MVALKKKNLLYGLFLSSTLFLSTVPLILGLQSSQSISSYGTVNYPATTIILRTSFEENDSLGLFDYQSIGWGRTDVCIVTRTDVLSHSGRYSVRLSLNDPSEDATRRIHIEKTLSPDTLEVINSAWYYLPAEFDTDTWVEIHRAVSEIWHEPGMPWEFPYYESFKQSVHVYKGSDGKFYLLVGFSHGEVSNPPLDPIYFRYTNVSFPKEKWMNIKTYVLRDRDNKGIFRMWQDGVLVMEEKNIRTWGISPDKLSGPNGVLTTGFSLYTDIGASPLTIFVDDVEIQTTG
jgi:hypothetical protein